MYDTLDKPPKPGSVLEALCLLVQRTRQVVEIHKTLALVQSVLSAQAGDFKNARTAFENYKKTALPYLERELEEEKKRILDAFQKEVERGPLRVSMLPVPNDLRNRLLRKGRQVIGAKK